jgi:hypothetical protein
MQNFGDEVYLDSTGKLRAKPGVMWRSLNASAPPSAYPLGSSVMTVGPENVTGWPGGNYGSVHTIKRLETTSNTASGQIQQWWYRNSSAEVQYRWAASDAGGWQPWIDLEMEDTGWVNITPTSGTGVCQYRCRMGVVTVRMALTSITSIASNNAGTIVNSGVLPAAYCPQSVPVYQAGSAAGSGMTLGVINAPSPSSISLWNPSYNSGALTVARLTFTYLKE